MRFIFELPELLGLTTEAPNSEAMICVVSSQEIKWSAGSLLELAVFLLQPANFTIFVYSTYFDFWTVFLVMVV